MRFAWKAAIALAGLLAALLVCALAVAVWLVATPGGLQWALERAVEAAGGRLAIEGASGTLAGSMRVRRLAWKSEGFEAEANEVETALDLPALFAATLRFGALRAESLELSLEQSGKAPASSSPSLRLPFTLELADVRLGEVSISRPSQEYTLEDVHGAARLGLDGIESLKLGAPRVDLARLDQALPRTRMDLELAGASTAGSLLSGTLSAANADAGPLDGGRLPLAALRARFSLKEKFLFIEEIQAKAAGGAVEGKGRVDAGRVRLELHLSKIDPASVHSRIPAITVSGNLTLDLSQARQSAAGTLQAPGASLSASLSRHPGGPFAVSGRLALSGFDPSRFGDYPKAKLDGKGEFSAHLQGARLSAAKLSAQLGENRLSASGSFGAPGDALAWSIDAPLLPIKALSGHLRASGTARGTWGEPRLSFSASASPAMIAGRLRAEEVQARFEGTLRAHTIWLGLSAGDADLDLSARLEGGWRGEAGWQGRLAALANRGRYPLALSAPAPIRASAKAVHAGPLSAQLGEGRIEVAALDWHPGRLATRGEFSALPAAWLLAAAGLGERLRSTLILAGDWSLESTPLLNGRVSVRRSSGELSVLEPARLDAGLTRAVLQASFEDGKVKAQLAVDSKLATLSAQATAGGFSREAPLAFSAALRVADIRLLASALPPVLRVGGHATLNLEGRGTIGEPQLRGTLQAGALSVQLPPYGVYLGDGTLRAVLEGDALRIEELELHGGKGSFSARGRVPLLAGAANAKLEWKAEQLRLLSRPDMRLVASGEGIAGLEGGRVQLQGKLRVDSGRFERGLQRLPSLSDDIEVLGGAPGASPAKRAAIPLDLEVLIDLGERFRVREAGFDGRLKGEAHLSSTPAGELRAFGRIEAADATFRAYGQSLTVDPGVVIFDGPIGNPALQVTAMRRNQAVEAGVRITGTLEQPHVELVSEPPVSESETLSWLVLGRAPAEATGADLGVLQAAASALLAKGNSVPITTRVAHAVGLDEISLRGSGELSSRVVAFGKRLSDRLYFTYEQGVGPVAQNLVKLDLSLTQRISLRAQTGSSTSGAGVYYRYSWD